MQTTSTLSRSISPITAALLDKQSLATRLGLSVRTLENMVKAREFPAGVRVGKFLYWTEEIVHIWQARKFDVQRAWRP
jgi:predicted DNA-binding transcriptional regulator AlpA